MKTIKKITLIALAMAVMTVFVGCSSSGSNEVKSLTSKELARIITEKGGEGAEYFEPVEFTSDVFTDEDGYEYQLFTGVYEWDLDDFEEGAVSYSLMMTQAYMIGIAKPREGKTDAVIAHFQAYKDAMIANFDGYLPDQYDNANNAVIEEYNGYVIIVMEENSRKIAEEIKSCL